MAFIYVVTNQVNQKVYVGETGKGKVEIRWEQHRRELRKGRHKNKHWQAAWSKYGESAFTWQVLEEFDPEMNFDANNLERYWIEKYQARNPEFGYNVQAGGRLQDKEWRERNSKAKAGKPSHRKGVKLSEAEKLHLRALSTGKTHSEESRSKMSAANQGIKKSAEQVQKMLTTKLKNQSSKLLCPTNGQVYDTPIDAAKALNLNNRLVSRVARGEMGSTGGFTFQWLRSE